MIGPDLFSILLVMALATTAMTGQRVTLFAGRKPVLREPAVVLQIASPYPCHAVL